MHYVAYLSPETGQREIYIRPYPVSPTGSPRPQYDVTADGQRFLLLTPSGGPDCSAERSRIVVVQNWFEELKRLVPVN